MAVPASIKAINIIITDQANSLFILLYQCIKMGFGSSKVKLSDIDADGDGVITREEVHNYVDKELGRWRDIYDERLEEWKKVYEQKLDLKEETIQELKLLLESRIIEKEAELEEWKLSYDHLHEKYNKLLNDYRSKAYENKEFQLRNVSNISPEAVEEAVDSILSDPNINLKKVPDFLEKRVYHNLIWITLMVAEKIMGSVRIDALGHEFYLAMSPKS